MTANNTKPCDPPPISEILNELCSSGEMPELLSPLPDEQRQAIVLLLTQGIKATASALGLSKMTIYRWRSQPDFRRAYLDEIGRIDYGQGPRTSARRTRRRP